MVPKSRGVYKEGVSIFITKARSGRLIMDGGSMLNRQYWDPNMRQPAAYVPAAITAICEPGVI